MREGQLLAAPVFPSRAPGNERHENQGDTHKNHVLTILSPGRKKCDDAHRRPRTKLPEPGLWINSLLQSRSHPPWLRDPQAGTPSSVSSTYCSEYVCGGRPAQAGTPRASCHVGAFVSSWQEPMH